jgi:hypothetical protein
MPRPLSAQADRSYMIEHRCRSESTQAHKRLKRARRRLQSPPEKGQAYGPCLGVQRKNRPHRAAQQQQLLDRRQGTEIE